MFNRKYETCYPNTSPKQTTLFLIAALLIASFLTACGENEIEVETREARTHKKIVALTKETCDLQRMCRPASYDPKQCLDDGIASFRRLAFCQDEFYDVAALCFGKVRSDGCKYDVGECFVNELGNKCKISSDINSPKYFAIAAPLTNVMSQIKVCKDAGNNVSVLKDIDPSGKNRVVGALLIGLSLGAEHPCLPDDMTELAACLETAACDSKKVEACFGAIPEEKGCSDILEVSTQPFK